MQIHEPGLYHIYNRGNNRQRIFFNDQNYEYFIGKCFRYLTPVTDILAWCLMPNHFHFLIEVNDQSMVPFRIGGIKMPAVTNAFRLLQSSYAKGINKQQNWVGNLFQQKTKAKLLTFDSEYPRIAFEYIHLNPTTARLVGKAADWKYSSIHEFLNESSPGLCNTARARDVLNLKDWTNDRRTNVEFDDQTLKNIF